MEGIIVEFNFRIGKWLLFGTYHPPFQANTYYFDNLVTTFDTYSSYEKCLLIGDFNTEKSESCIDSSVYGHELHNLVKEKTCFKPVHNTSCVGLILKNNAMVFHNTTTIFIGLLDFYKLVWAVLKRVSLRLNLKKLFTENKRILILLDLMTS